MKPDIHTIIEMMHSDPAGVTTKFGIPLRTVYSWCSGARRPPDYLICMMLNIILLERRLNDHGDTIKELETGMGDTKQGIKETCEKS